jgi:2-hydroxycyclohexanecarboxyl-CoA dehydrogenase
MISLNGKNAVVTGGASGIGRATALTLAEAGARVFIGDINDRQGPEAAAEAVKRGHKAEFVRLDLTDDASVKDFAAEVLRRAGLPSPERSPGFAQAGRIDILVNAAGWDMTQPFMDNTPDYWNKVIALNLMGPIKLCHALLPPMIAARSGKIVNVSSDAGRVGSSGETVYAGAKGGIMGFTKSLAREMARHSINVNCICPGPTDTPLFQVQPEKIRDALARAIPFRRIGRPQEVADAILFFASDRASYITGQVLSVSGGLTMSG